MTWAINPTITINGTPYVSNTVGSVEIDYGRVSVWDFQRAGYATVNLVNSANTNYGIKISDSIVITVANATNTANLTVFTGQVTQVSSRNALTDGSSYVVYITITAIGPLAILARTQVGAVAYPSENEAQRITRILAETTATVGTINTGTYTLIARAINPNDALNLCNAYALTATGSMWESTDGKINYANELSRNSDVTANGYYAIPTNVIDPLSLKSLVNLGDVINTVKIQYNGSSYYNTANSASQTTYGIISGTIQTDISNEPDANTLGNIYLGMRAYPQTSLSTIDISLKNSNATNALINKMLGMYFGLPIQVASLPASIYNTTYYGFIEGWKLSFNQVDANISLRSTEKTYSFRYTQWEDVTPPLLQWDGVAPTLQWIDYQ